MIKDKPKHRTRQETENHLFNHAYDLSLEKGLLGWTNADLARRADFPLGNLFYYYKKKNQLIEKIVHSRLKGWGGGDGSPTLHSLRHDRLNIECQIYMLEKNTI